MKIFRLLQISLLSFLSLFREQSVPAFNSITISPFMIDRETKIVVDTSSSYLRFQIFIKNDKYKLGTQIASATLTKPGKYTYVYDNRYTRSKNEVFIKYSTSSSGSLTTSSSFTFNRFTSSSLDFSDDTVLESRSSLGVFKSDLSFEYKKVTYKFIGFNDLHVPDYYHKIGLEDFKILVDEEFKPFVPSAASIMIQNVNGIFNDIANADDNAVFNLDLVEINGGFTFALANTQHVDPVTLLMSTNPKANYVQTEHIYLPVNTLSRSTEIETLVGLSDFGIDKDYLYHRFSIKVLDNILGDCATSEYCVVRESK